MTCDGPALVNLGDLLADLHEDEEASRLLVNAVGPRAAHHSSRCRNDGLHINAVVRGLPSPEARG